jgi:hypothetical protein
MQEKIISEAADLESRFTHFTKTILTTDEQVEEWGSNRLFDLKPVSLRIDYLGNLPTFNNPERTPRYKLFVVYQETINERFLSFNKEPLRERIEGFLHVYNLSEYIVEVAVEITSHSVDEYRVALETFIDEDNPDYYLLSDGTEFGNYPFGETLMENHQQLLGVLKKLNKIQSYLNDYKGQAIEGSKGFSCRVVDIICRCPYRLWNNLSIYILYKGDFMPVYYLGESLKSYFDPHLCLVFSVDNKKELTEWNEIVDDFNIFIKGDTESQYSVSRHSYPTNCRPIKT